MNIKMMCDRRMRVHDGMLGDDAPSHPSASIPKIVGGEQQVVNTYANLAENYNKPINDGQVLRILATMHPAMQPCALAKPSTTGGFVMSNETWDDKPNPQHCIA